MNFSHFIWSLYLEPGKRPDLLCSPPDFSKLAGLLTQLGIPVQWVKNLYQKITHILTSDFRCTGPFRKEQQCDSHALNKSFHVSLLQSTSPIVKVPKENNLDTVQYTEFKSTMISMANKFQGFKDDTNTWMNVRREVRNRQMDPREIQRETKTIRAIQEMRTKFNEEIKVLKKSQTNVSGNEKLNKSNKNAQWKPSPQNVSHRRQNIRAWMQGRETGWSIKEN